MVEAVRGETMMNWEHDSSNPPLGTLVDGSIAENGPCWVRFIPNPEGMERYFGPDWRECPGRGERLPE